MIKNYYTYVNEGANDRFTYDDRVISKYQGVGTVIRVHRDNWYGVEFDDWDRGHDCEGGSGRPGRKNHCWNLSPEELEYVKPEDKIKQEKRREEQRLKHLEIDPYGEDDWEN
jgi:hypothetical protein